MKSLDSVLKIEVYDKDVGEIDDIQGSISLPLINLDNQTLIDQWFELSTANQTEEGQIRLRLQLIWSKFTYYQNLVKNSEEKMDKIRSELNELEKYFELFNLPFGILLYCDLDDHLIKKIWGDEAENYAPHMNMTTSLPNLGHFNSTIRNTNLFASTVGNVIRGTFLSN